MTPATNHDLDEILNDKMIKAKKKVAIIGDLLITGSLTVQQLKDQTQRINEINKATLIESLEYASKLKPDLVDRPTFEFAIANLAANAPRIRWESAKVIANTAHLFPQLHKQAVSGLLANTEHSGTVVRWSTAGALSRIVLLKTELNKELIPALVAIERREEDHGVKKIYQQALKKASSQVK